jgi:hypothetical protein
MLTADRIAEIADRILRSNLESFGYERVEIREGKDQDDRDALFLVGHLSEHDGLVPGEVLNRTHVELSDALLDEREERFPYFSLEFAGDEAPELESRRDH